MDIIRRHTDYAIRTLLCLAEEDGEILTGQRLAESCDVPTSFAYKILRKLAEAGIVDSRRGRPGGFRLSRRPEDISLREVVEAVQGSVSVGRCVQDPGACDRSRGCPVSPKWDELQRRIVGFLEGTTIADICAWPEAAGAAE